MILGLESYPSLSFGIDKYCLSLEAIASLLDESHQISFPIILGVYIMQEQEIIQPMDSGALPISLDAISLTSVGAYLLFDEINELSARGAVDFILKANVVMEDMPLTLFVYSGGGDVTAGNAIINTMEMSRLPISTVAIGCVASMGLFISVAGTKGLRKITPNTLVMSHQFSSGFWGKQHELIAARTLHDQLERAAVAHFVRHSNMSANQVRDVLLGPSDRWLTATECLKYGLVDKICSPWEIEDEQLLENEKKDKKKKKKKND